MKTVKVRIAVAVDPKGKWYACGWNTISLTVDGETVVEQPSDGAMLDCCIDAVDPGDAHYFITAELAIPEAQEITGTVESE